jgi:electron transfer DM13
MPAVAIRRSIVAAVGVAALVVAVVERDRLDDTIPRTASGWLRVGPLVAGLVIALLVVLPRLVRDPNLRLVVAAAVLGVTAWFTIVPVFFDTRVDEQLLGTTGPATATTVAARVPPPVAPAAPAPTVPTTQAGPVRLTTGPLQGRGGHSASGAASVYRLPDGSAFVRLENIDTPHAPAVYVYLVPRAEQTGPGGGVDLGSLKGNQGSQNYVIPRDVDIGQYKTVLLWCRRFSTPIAIATQAAG